MEPLDDALASLIAAETEAVSPPQGAKARHWAAVAAAVGPVAGPPDGAPDGAPDGGASAGTPAAPTAAATGAKTATLLKIVGGTVAAGALALGTWTATRPDDPEPQAPAVATPDATDPPDPEPVTDPDPDPDPEPEPEPEPDPDPDPDPNPDPDPKPTTSKPKPPALTLADELALVESLRKAVSSGHDTEALALARRHRRQFPKGSLIPDRLDLEARASCRSGKTSRGQSLVAELERRWPRAPVSDRTRRACDLKSESKP